MSVAVGGLQMGIAILLLVLGILVAISCAGKLLHRQVLHEQVLNEQAPEKGKPC